MTSHPGWSPDAHVVFRHVWFDRILAAFPVTVVDDTPKRISVYIAPGTQFMRLNCTRDEYLRVIASRKWDLVEDTWRDLHMLWTSVPGQACSVWTIWDEKWQHQGWKVNPEAAWKRTSIGFDTTDHALDVAIAPDFSWTWKDEDEFAEAIRLGLLTQNEATAVRDEAEKVLDRLLTTGRIEAERQAAWRPDSTWSVPSLPPEWENP